MSLFDLNDYYVGEEGAGSWNPSLTAPEGTSIYIVDPTTTKVRSMPSFAATVGQYFTHPGDAILSGGATWWRAFWIRTRRAAETKSIANVRVGSTGWEIYRTTAGIRVRVNGGNYAASSALQVDGWDFIYCEYDGVNVGVSINGGALTQVAEAFTSAVGQFVFGANYQLVGEANDDMPNFFGGDGNLTPEQIDSLFALGEMCNYGGASSIASPGFYYRWSDASGTMVDEVGALDLTNNGSVVPADGYILETPRIGDGVYSISDYMNVQVDLNADYVADPADRPKIQQDLDGNYYLDMLTGVYDSLRARVGNTYWDGDRRDITVVFERNATNTNPYLFGGHNPGGSNFYMRCFGAELRYRWGGSGTGELRTTGAGIAADTKTVVQALIDSRADESGACYGYVNGGLFGSYWQADVGLKPSQDSIFMGARDGGTSSAVRIYYMQILPSAWNTKGYREQLNDWLAARYNLTVTKPVDPATDVPAGAGIYKVDPAYCFSKAGAKFDGTHGMTSPATFPTRDGTKPFFVAYWARSFTGTGASGAQVSKGNAFAAGGEWRWKGQTNSQQWIVRSADDAVNANLLVPITQDTWKHLIGWFDPTLQEIGGAADDGVPVTAAAFPASLVTSNPIEVGRLPTGTEIANNDIAQVIVCHDYLPTAADRTWLYNAGNGRTADEIKARFGANLVAGWRLDEATGNRVDFVGSNDMVPTGAVAVTDGPVEEAARVGTPVTRFADSLGVLPDLEPFTPQGGGALDYGRAPTLLMDILGWYILGDRVDDLLSCRDIAVPVVGPHECVYAGSVDNGYVFDGPESGNYRNIISSTLSGAFLGIYSGLTLTSTYNPPDTTTEVVSGQFNGASSILRLKAEEILNGDAGGPQDFRGLTLLSRMSGANYLDGPFRYLIFSPGVLLSADQRRNAEQWLIERYKFA